MIPKIGAATGQGEAGSCRRHVRGPGFCDAVTARGKEASLCWKYFVRMQSALLKRESGVEDSIGNWHAPGSLHDAPPGVLYYGDYGAMIYPASWTCTSLTIESGFAAGIGWGLLLLDGRCCCLSKVRLQTLMRVYVVRHTDWSPPADGASAGQVLVYPWSVPVLSCLLAG